MAKAGELSQDLVRKGRVHRAPKVQSIIAAGAALKVALELVGRFLHHYVDRSASRIAAEQGALWTAQHFDTLHIEQAEVVGVLARDIDVIDIGPDWNVLRSDGFSVADAADVISIGSSEADVVVADEVRYLLDQIDGIANLLAL